MKDKKVYLVAQKVCNDGLTKEKAIEQAKMLAEKLGQDYYVFEAVVTVTVGKPVLTVSEHLN